MEQNVIWRYSSLKKGSWEVAHLISTQSFRTSFELNKPRRLTFILYDDTTNIHETNIFMAFEPFLCENKVSQYFGWVFKKRF